MADGEPGAGPMRVGVAVTDLFTGVYAATAILAALHVRHRTGQGQHIDMALLDVGIAMLANQASNYLNTGIVPQRQGNSHPSIVPYQDFPTADGAMLLAVGNDGQFRRFCEVAGQPQWADDARFAKNVDRVRNRAALIALMNEVTRKRSTAQWVALLEDKARAVRADQRHRARVRRPAGRSARLAHRAARKRASARSPASPVRCACRSRRRCCVTRRRISANTPTSVLREVLGIGDDAIEALKAAHVI